MSTIIKMRILANKFLYFSYHLIVSFILKIKKLWPIKMLPKPSTYRSIIWGDTQKLADSIPPVIWTYWSGKKSECAQACFASLQIKNKDFKINLITEDNLLEYLPNFPKLPKDLDVQVFSDYVRLSLLKRYGGIWIDYSVIVTSPLTWILDAAREGNAELVCFYNEHPKTYNKDHSRPIIENGFLAASKGSSFISDWHRHFQECVLSNNWRRYYSDRDDFHILTSNFIIKKGITYFSCYLAAQETMIKSNNYRLLLINAEDEYYFYLYQIRSFIKRVTFCDWVLMAKEPPLVPNLIKIRKMHRELVDICIKKNYYNKYSILGKYIQSRKEGR